MFGDVSDARRFRDSGPEFSFQTVPESLDVDVFCCWMCAHRTAEFRPYRVQQQLRRIEVAALSDDHSKMKVSLILRHSECETFFVSKRWVVKATRLGFAFSRKQNTIDIAPGALNKQTS